MALNLKTETVFTGDTSATQPPLPPEQIAPHFAQLEIIECLGRGGMGVVYKARQKSLNRLVALKLLAPERVTDAKFAERFTREAHALAALNHPHIVTIYDFGQAGGFYFLLMEFVDGLNLRQLLETRRLKPEEALAIVPPLCDALQYAHEQGIVHRDIKPANLLLDKGGRVKIADFGIAKMVGDSSSVGIAESQPAGTPQYMAPEQKAQRATDHRADIYSLGVVLYEMLTGELPTDKLQPPSRKVQIDVRLDEIVLRALERTPELRFATAAEFRTQVEAVTAPVGTTLKTSHPRPAATPKALATATVVAIFFGILLFGIPFVDMFRVQKDSAHIAVILFALAASIFAGLRAWSSLPLLKTSQWWFKPLSMVAFVSAIPAVGLALFFAPNLPKGFDNPSLSEALLVPICFLGSIALPLAGVTLWRAPRQDDNSPEATAGEEPDSSRMSRLAVIGACWVPVAIASIIAGWLVLQLPRDGVNPLWWQLAMLVPLLILAVVGPFGTTILGWLAVAEISRSGGKVHGLHLAVFSGLVYPLMVLSGILTAGFIYAIRVVTNQPSAGLAFVILAVAITIVVNVLIVRAVMHAVRKDTAAAPREGSVTGNQIKLASLALIFAVISTAIGGLAAVRSGGAWPAMALTFVFVGISIFMALPVRRLGAGKSAIIVASLGMVIWSLVGLFISRANFRAGSDALDPAIEKAEIIEKVEVAKDQVVVQQRRHDGEGMIFLFGTKADAWTPGGLYLDAMFDIRLSGHRLGQGADWVVKPRHGIHARYRLDGPPGPMVGKIIFHPDRVAVEPDGSYVIGEFKPDNGNPLPISVKLEKTERTTTTAPNKSKAMQPVLENLGWEPVGVNSNVVIVNVHTSVRGGPVELSANMNGPLLSAEAQRQLALLAGPKPASLVHPVVSAEHLPRTLQQPGAKVWQIGFVLPDAAAAEESFRTMHATELGRVSLDADAAWDVFRATAADGQEYRGFILLNRTVPSKDSNRVSVGPAKRSVSFAAIAVLLSICVIAFLLVPKSGLVRKAMLSVAGVMLLLFGVSILVLISWRASRVEEARTRALLAAQSEEAAIAKAVSVREQAKPASVPNPARPFALRHRLADEMADQLQQILLGKPGHEAKPSAENLELLVTAPPDVLARVQTFITINDWPDPITRGSNFEYPHDSVIRAARSFFYACAIEDSMEAFNKLLSTGVLAALKDDTKSKEFASYEMGGVPDANWEKSMRADWPGKKEAIERFVRNWNRYPLKRIQIQPGIAIGFGEKHFCSASFEGAPQPFYRITIEPDRSKARDGNEPALLFSSLPPWGDVRPALSSKELELPYRDKQGVVPRVQTATREGRYDLGNGVTFIVSLKPASTVGTGKDLAYEGRLEWPDSARDGKVPSAKVSLSDGSPFVAAWETGGRTLWVACGPMNEGRTMHYVQEIKMHEPGNLEPIIHSLADEPSIPGLPDGIRQAFNANAVTFPAPVTKPTVPPQTTTPMNPNAKHDHWNQLRRGC